MRPCSCRPARAPFPTACADPPPTKLVGSDALPQRLPPVVHFRGRSSADLPVGLRRPMQHLSDTVLRRCRGQLLSGAARSLPGENLTRALPGNLDGKRSFSEHSAPMRPMLAQMRGRQQQQGKPAKRNAAFRRACCALLGHWFKTSAERALAGPEPCRGGGRSCVKGKGPAKAPASRSVRPCASKVTNCLRAGGGLHPVLSRPLHSRHDLPGRPPGLHQAPDRQKHISCAPNMACKRSDMRDGV